MKRLSMLLGGIGCALATGAITGTSMSTDPIAASTDIAEMLPERRTIQQPKSLDRVRPLPDHYPLETPEGTIEVHELAWHGRYRDRARGWRDLPTDEELFGSASASPRYEASSATAMLDAQQPKPEPRPAIARLDAAQAVSVRSGRRIAQVSTSARSGEPSTTPQPTPRATTPPQADVSVSSGNSESQRGHSQPEGQGNAQAHPPVGPQSTQPAVN